MRRIIIMLLITQFLYVLVPFRQETHNILMETPQGEEHVEDLHLDGGIILKRWCLLCSASSGWGLRVNRVGYTVCFVNLNLSYKALLGPKLISLSRLATVSLK